MRYIPLLHDLIEWLTGRSYAGNHGHIPSEPDQRDVPMSVLPDVAELPPSSASLVAHMGEVRDQGVFNSCVGHALASAMDLLRNKRIADTMGADPRVSARPLVPLSPMFPWTRAKSLEGTLTENIGVQPRDALKVASQDGVCLDTFWPDDADHASIAQESTVGGIAALAEAQNHKVTAYLAASNLDDVRQSISSGYPVILAFPVYASALSNDGHIGLPPTTGERPRGTHEVLGLAYDDQARLITFLNSWGSWGSSGLGFLPYEYVTRGYTFDMWSIRDEDTPELRAAVQAFIAKTAQDIADNQAKLDAEAKVIAETQAVIDAASRSRP